MELPAKMKTGTRLATEWNKLIDYLRSVRPAPGTGTGRTHTPHGTIHSTTTGPSRGRVVYVKLCFEDSTEAYIPIWAVGPALRSLEEGTLQMDIIEAAVPAGSTVAR